MGYWKIRCSPTFRKTLGDVVVFFVFCVVSRVVFWFKLFQIANLSTQTYCNIFWTFLELRKVTKNRALYPLFITKIIQQLQENQTTPSKTYSYISQLFINPKCSQFWKLPDIKHVKTNFIPYCLFPKFWWSENNWLLRAFSKKRNDAMVES